MAEAVFHGNHEELFRLTEACAHHCTCRVVNNDLEECPPHAMLNGDQRALDGMLFERRRRSALLKGEFSVK